MTFYIADLHFGHKNVLSYDNREFISVEEHDEFLIEQWNSTVGIDDEVWILGDISWYPPMKTIAILKRLNGIKHLVVGNHDKKLMKNLDVRNQFVEITDYKEISFDDGKGIVLCHYPIPCYNHHYYGWYHLYGHVHNTFEWNIMKRVQFEMRVLHNQPSHMYNVGCMLPYMDYKPRTLTEILDAHTNKKTPEKILDEIINGIGQLSPLDDDDDSYESGYDVCKKEILTLIHEKIRLMEPEEKE